MLLLALALLIVFLLIGGTVVAVWMESRRSPKQRANPAPSAQTMRKEEAKQKILAAIGEKGEIQNSEIALLLGASEASVTRYMDELELEGAVEQVGKTGRGVTYRKRLIPR